MAKLTQLFHEPGALLNDFVVDWSKDNKVAVATQHAVCIYEVRCKPHEKELTAAGVLTKILPEKEQNLCFDKDIPLQGICREKHQRVTDVFLDTGITAITTQHDTFTGFRRALWSPPGMASCDSCLLATLSWDRRLRVYDVQSSKPRMLAEISKQWIKHHAQPPSQVKTLDDVRRRAYALSIIDMAWSSVTEGPAGALRCHLVTVSRSGQVAVWRLTAGSDQVRLVSHWWLPDPDDRVTCLTCLESGVLLLGRFSGRVSGYGLGLGDEVTVTEPWPLMEEADQLAVTCIIASDSGPEPPLLIAKGFAVVALTFARSGDTAAVIGTTFVRLEGGQVTGLSLLSPGKAIVSMMYNKFWTVSLTGHDSPALTSAPITVLLEPVHYSCHALAASPNSVIICTAERVFDYYDHLVLREPIRVSFTLLEQPLDELLNSALTTSLPLRRLSDVLEAARLTMLVDKTPFSLVSDDEALSRQASRHLQCTLFMACSSQSQRNLAPVDASAVNLEQYAEKLRWYLLRSHLSAVLERSTDFVYQPGPSSSSGPSSAPSADTAAFRARAEALIAGPVGSLAGLTAVMPACGVCEKGIASMTSLQAVCRAGHKLPVCCQTLALCDAVPYRRCQQCGAFSVSETTSVTGLDLGPWCTFCDGRLSTSR